MTAGIPTTSLRLAKAVLFIGLAALATTQTRAESLTFHVAPGGNGSWSGRLAEPNPAGTDGPLASIDLAQRAIRDLRKEGKVPGPVTVLIRGSHQLASPIVFTPEDSGTPQCPITYEAFAGEQPVLYGAQTITGWQPYQGEILVIDGNGHFLLIFQGNNGLPAGRSLNERSANQRKQSAAINEQFMHHVTPIN